MNHDYLISLFLPLCEKMAKKLDFCCFVPILYFWEGAGEGGCILTHLNKFMKLEPLLPFFLLPPLLGA